MATLFSFQDGIRRGYSYVRMNDGDSVFISTSPTGVIVRNSRVGFFGPKLFESTSPDDAVTVALTLSRRYRRQITPPGMDDPVLIGFTKAVLFCSTVDEVSDVFRRYTDDPVLEVATAIG